jgi:hypothetical protein
MIQDQKIAGRGKMRGKLHSLALEVASQEDQLIGGAAKLWDRGDRWLTHCECHTPTGLCQRFSEREATLYVPAANLGAGIRTEDGEG